jgi:hypothetical protein
VIWNLVRLALALSAAVVIYLVGASIIRKFAVPPPEEPDPDDLRPVDLEFRCAVCGARVTMTRANRDADVEAPRHCREDMVAVTGDGGSADTT